MLRIVDLNAPTAAMALTLLTPLTLPNGLRT